MFAGLTGPKNSPNADFGERMLSAIATQSIRHLFSHCESVEVDIRCNPSSKLLQGSIDSFQMQGRNLMIRRDFHVESMSFETDAVSLDPGSVLGGNIRLKQPTQAVAQVVLTEEGINKAFESELVQRRLVGIDLEAVTNLSGGEAIAFRNIRLELLPQNQVKIFAETDLPNRKDVPIHLKATLAVEKRRRISFQNAEFDTENVPPEVQGLSQILTLAFADVLNGMVDLDRFDLDGVMLRINRLETQEKKLIFSGYAQIDHFPKGGK